MDILSRTAYLGLIPLLLLCACVHAGDDVGELDAAHPVSGDYVPLTCWNFTIGDWKHREFYSPMYPDNYSNSTECMQLLVAPKGHRIRLDFRDEFHIERSDGCKYDFLELRDGPFGYSQLLGRYCGETHPPITESSSRFLWIRFKSDDSIEYKGFRAVFDFFRPEESALSGGFITPAPPAANLSRDYDIEEDEVCRIEVPVASGEGFLRSADLPKTFLEMNNKTGRPIDCTYVLYAPPKHRVYLRWPEYKMPTPQNCADSFLEVYERTTALSDRRKQICGRIARDFKSTSNHVYLRLFAQSSLLVPKFEALYTIYTAGPCDEDKFDCGDDTCIPRHLVCDGTVNCNYSWDEMNCDGGGDSGGSEAGAVLPTSTEKPLMVRYHTIILSVVGAVILLIIVISICITCQQRKKEERRRQLALKQDERRAIEVEMTNLLNQSQRGTPVHGGPGSNHMGRAAANAIAAGNHSHNHINGHNSKQRNGGAGTTVANHVAATHHPAGAEYEITNLDLDGATYQRFKDVDEPHYVVQGEDALMQQQQHTTTTAVTLERPPAGNSRRQADSELTIHNKGYNPGPPPSAAARDGAPSPRPDVVQEEKFLYQPAAVVDNSGSHLRRASVDTVKSDVWKPMTTGYNHRVNGGSGNNGGIHTLTYPAGGKVTSLTEPSTAGTRTLPRVNFNLDHIEHPASVAAGSPKHGASSGSVMNHVGGGSGDSFPPPPLTHPAAYHPDSVKRGVGGVTYPPTVGTLQSFTDEDPYINPRNSHYPPGAGATTGGHYGQTLPSNRGGSSTLQHKVPPKPPQRSPQTELQSGAVGGTLSRKSSAASASADTPDIFYTRPRRQIPNPQARHAEV